MESGLICLVPCTEFRANLIGFELSRTRINRSDGDSHRPARALPSSFSGSEGFSQIHLDSKRDRQLHWISIRRRRPRVERSWQLQSGLPIANRMAINKSFASNWTRTPHEEVPFRTRSIEACLSVRLPSEPWPNGRVPCAYEESGRLSC